MTLCKVSASKTDTLQITFFLHSDYGVSIATMNTFGIKLHETSNYTLSGNKFVDKDGQTYTIHSISGSTMRISNRGETLTLTKYNGTAQQLIDYLNK